MTDCTLFQVHGQRSEITGLELQRVGRNTRQGVETPARSRLGQFPQVRTLNSFNSHSGCTEGLFTQKYPRTPPKIIRKIRKKIKKKSEKNIKNLRIFF